MPIFPQDYVDKWDYASWLSHDIQTYYYFNADVAWYDGDYVDALYWAIQGMGVCGEAIGNLCSMKDGTPYNSEFIAYLAEHIPTNMDDILNAMMEANFEQLKSFIGIKEAYQCALWDAPFNADYYAALARGFKVW